MRLGKFSLLLMAKFCKSNVVIWSHWRRRRQFKSDEKTSQERGWNCGKSFPLSLFLSTGWWVGWRRRSTAEYIWRDRMIRMLWRQDWGKNLSTRCSGTNSVLALLTGDKKVSTYKRLHILISTWNFTSRGMNGFDGGVHLDNVKRMM